MERDLRHKPPTGMHNHAPPRLHEPRGVAGHLVDLDIDLVARVALAPGRHLQSVRNQQHLERIALDRIDRERRPVERDRALDSDEFRQILRRADKEMRHAVEIAPGEDFRDPVDVAAHHMAAKLVADLKRPLEVDMAPLPPFPERRHRERLGPDVEGDRRTAHARLDADHCQARAGIGDRGADGNRFGVVSAGDPESPQIAGRRNINDLSDVADNPSEHPKTLLARVPTLPHFERPHLSIQQTDTEFSGGGGRSLAC